MRGLNETHPLRIMGAESKADTVIAWQGSVLAGVRNVNMDMSTGDIKYTITLDVGGDYGKRERLINLLDEWGVKVIRNEI